MKTPPKVMTPEELYERLSKEEGSVDIHAEISYKDMTGEELTCLCKEVRKQGLSISPTQGLPEIRIGSWVIKKEIPHNIRITGLKQRSRDLHI